MNPVQIAELASIALQLIQQINLIRAQSAAVSDAATAAQWETIKQQMQAAVAELDG